MKPLRCTTCKEWRDAVFEACACGLPKLAPRERVARAVEGVVASEPAAELFTFDPVAAEWYRRAGLKRWAPQEHVFAPRRGVTLDMFAGRS